MTTKTVRLTSTFKRDLRRERKADRMVDTLLVPVVDDLLLGNTLAKKYQDHALTGQWKPCRECHIKPDLLLIYDWEDEDTLVLVRLGSHSELNL